MNDPNQLGMVLTIIRAKGWHSTEGLALDRRGVDYHSADRHTSGGRQRELLCADARQRAPGVAPACHEARSPLPNRRSL